MSSTPSPEMTVEQFLLWDLETHVRAVLRPSTALQYERNLQNYWGPLLGQRRLSELTQAMIQQATIELQTQRDLAPTTTHTALGLLQASLERAFRNRLLPFNPAARVRGPHLVRTKPRALSIDELNRWMDAALLPSGLGGFFWSGAMLATAPLTGLRFGELRGLRWENVDLWEDVEIEGDRAGMIHVVEQIDSAQRRTGHEAWTTPKSASGERSVPVSVELARILQLQRERVERRARRAGTRVWRENGLVFPSVLGNAVNHETMNKQRHRVAELAMIDPVPDFHALRHTFASNLIDGGVPLATVAALLGHADVTLCARTYYNPGDQAHQDAAAAVAAAYSRSNLRRRG